MKSPFAFLVSLWRMLFKSKKPTTTGHTSTTVDFKPVRMSTSKVAPVMHTLGGAMTNPIFEPKRGHKSYLRYKRT